MSAQTVPEPTTQPEEAMDTETPAQGDDDDHAATAAINAEGGLTDAQLLEVFKQTSVFNVRSALAGNEVLMGGPEEVDDPER